MAKHVSNRLNITKRSKQWKKTNQQLYIFIKTVVLNVADFLAFPIIYRWFLNKKSLPYCIEVDIWRIMKSNSCFPYYWFMHCDLILYASQTEGSLLRHSNFTVTFFCSGFDDPWNMINRHNFQSLPIWLHLFVALHLASLSLVLDLHFRVWVWCFHQFHRKLLPDHR